jgi:hypothetical protein
VVTPSLSDRYPWKKWRGAILLFIYYIILVDILLIDRYIILGKPGRLRGISEMTLLPLRSVSGMYEYTINY